MSNADHDTLTAIHNDAIRAMNAADETLRYLGSAAMKARDARAAAEKTAKALEPLLRAAYEAEKAGK